MAIALTSTPAWRRVADDPIAAPIATGLAAAAGVALLGMVVFGAPDGLLFQAIVLGVLAGTRAAVGDVRIPRMIASAALFAFGTYVAAKWVFNPPTGLMIYATALGALYGLLGAGIIIIYRTHRVVNFAVGGMGSVPSIFALTLVTQGTISYWIATPLAFVGGAVLGLLIDVVIMRRFAQASRLIVTVVTIGLAALLAFVSFMIPIWLGVKGLPPLLRTPFKRFEWSVGGSIITGDYAVAAVVVAIVAVLLGGFFKYTRMGIAVRASAENADRARLLGIPVERVGTVAWTIAGLLSAITVFLRSPLVGLPLGGLGSPTVLLFALTAAVIAKMQSIPIAIGAGMAIGIIDQSSVFQTGRSDYAQALMLPVILVALLVQRGHVARAFDTGVSTFRAVREFRPIPLELRRLPEVIGARVALAAIVLAAAIGAPWYLKNDLGDLTQIVIFAMVAVSLVILTGWAGQISLGQFAFVGVGAAVAAGLSANHQMDFFATLILSGLAGALAAIVIGLPALRVQGMFLAVTTLAFAAAATGYLFQANEPFGKLVLPDAGNSVYRPNLLQRFSLMEERPYYFFCLVMLALLSAAAMAFRRNRSGRVLVALRDNSRAASSYGLNLARNRLAAFAVSGFIAAVAGALMVHQAESFDPNSYGVASSISVFAAAVIGGITSIGGAVFGVIVVKALSNLSDVIGLDQLELLVTGPGLILVLMVLPGGFGEGLFRLRDHFLRWVANKRGIHVPSLVADRRIEGEEAKDDSIITLAEEKVEAAETFSEVLSAPSIVCPVCSEELDLEAAAEHEHLRGDDRQPAGAGAGGGE